MKSQRKRPPEMFRPLLWYSRWKDIDINENKEDIIVNTINDGTLKHWRWIIQTYGKDGVRRILRKRLATEFHPESLNLARLIFDLPPLRNARRSS